MNQKQTRRVENMENKNEIKSHYSEITSWEDKDLNLKDKLL